MDRDGRYRFVNQRYEEWFGLPRAQILGRHCREVLGEAAFKLIRDRVEAALSGQHVCYEEALPYRHGGVRWVMAEYVPDTNAEGEVDGFFALVTDLTERKRAEEALRESEECYRSLVESADDSIYLVDREGRYLFLNNKVLSRLGLPLAQVAGRAYGDFHSPEQTREFAGKIAQVFQSGESLSYEHQSQRDERFFLRTISPVKEPDGTTRAVTVVSKDVTEFKKAEEALQKSRQLLEKTFAGLQEAVFIIEAETAEIINCNPSASEIFGYSREEMIGRRTAFLHLNEDKAEEFQADLKQALEEKGFLFRPEFTMRRKDGTVFPAEHRVQPLEDEQGRPVAWVSVIRDVTEKKEMEAQLLQAQKMEALGTLVAGVAHEINNPINLIMFNVPLLQKIWHDLLPILEEQARTEPGRKYGGLSCDFLKEHLSQLLSDMNMAAGRVAKIVTSLKNFARQPSAAERGPVRINTAVDNALRLAGTTLRKAGIELELDLADNLPLFEGNLQNIEQIILNLIINAAEAIQHDQGQIRIATGWQDKDRRVCVWVSDNGSGVEPALAERLFDPFVTSRQAQGGTGLGLSVTYNLVRAHGGEITFQSEPGQGTTFTVSFPTAPKRREARILVVDDDEVIRNMLAEALSKKRPYLVDVAANGVEACVKLGTYRPDLLILDIFMPGMDGLEVCRVLKREPKLAEVKVIVITGFPDHDKAKELADLGFTHTYAKPFDLRQILKDADDLLAEA